MPELWFLAAEHANWQHCRSSKQRGGWTFICGVVLEHQRLRLPVQVSLVGEVGHRPAWLLLQKVPTLDVQTGAQEVVSHF